MASLGCGKSKSTENTCSIVKNVDRALVKKKVLILG